jgi:type I site-specific restriction endonuclease
MVTGSGKTLAAVSFIYRLIKHANARRVLFGVEGGLRLADNTELASKRQGCALSAGVVPGHCGEQT